MQVAKLLQVDQSTAWRRLEVARKKGYVRNIETRKYQSGRYRVTDHKLEIEEILPTVDALREQRRALYPPESTHTCIRSTFMAKIQRVIVCSEPMHTPDVCAHTPRACEPYANANAYANDLESNDKSRPYARMHGNQGGETGVAPSSPNPEDEIPELPSFLDRRKRHSSPASEPGSKVPVEETLAAIRQARGEA